jgi:hypothetical protein
MNTFYEFGKILKVWRTPWLLNLRSDLNSEAKNTLIAKMSNYYHCLLAQLVVTEMIYILGWISFWLS